jgi:hypothetical protein
MVGSTMEPPMVLATLVERYAPAKFNVPASNTAARGERTLVETTVAIAFAASFQPLAKSNIRATTTTNTIRTSGSTIYPPRFRIVTGTFRLRVF